MTFLALPAQSGCFLPVVYEDDHILVFHKAAGVHSTPRDSQETTSAVSSALAHLPELSKVANRPSEPGLLHRLDQGTSGLLVFAKTQRDYENIKKIWKTPLLKKVYRAWVISHQPLEKLPLEIDTPIGHSAKSAKRMIAIRSEAHLKRIRAKPLKTLTRILKIHSELKISPHPFPLLYDLEIEIQTGVRHQIRCHLADLGFPIVGDPIYGSTQDKQLSQQLGSSRMYLHSWRLELPLPQYRLKIEAQLPKSWASFETV